MWRRGALMTALVVIGMTANAQAPTLVLQATFDGSCALETGGAGELVAGEFVDGRDGQAIRATEEGRPAALIPLGAADPDEGTLMLWFRPEQPKPAAEGEMLRWSPVTTAGAAGPDVSVIQRYNESQIATGNPWDERHRGGAREVYGHLIPGKWYHLAVTWRRAEHDLCFWLFGVAQSDTLGKWNIVEPREAPWGEMLSVGDVEEILGLKTVGVIPESGDVLHASNKGEPVILEAESDAAQAYDDAVARLLGDTRPMRFVQVDKKNFFSKMFGG